MQGKNGKMYNVQVNFFVSNSLCITADFFMDFEDGSFSIKIVRPYSVMVVPNLPPEIEMEISLMTMHNN